MLAIQLLGRPQITRAGSNPAPPRGQKAWGLLAYLLLSEIRNPTREHLAALLFAEAADPLRSLRWNLTELRKALGPEALPSGTLTLTLPPDATIDVDVLTRGTPQEALALDGLDHELLEGMDFSASPSYESWLAQERHRLTGAASSALHEAALDRLADRRPKDAVALARRLVDLEPYDENFQELLIRSYAQSGDRRAAEQQLASCRELFQRELGRAPADSLGEAVDEPAGDEPQPSMQASIGQAAGALLEAGEAAASAGATDAALQSLRRAVTLARDGSEPELEARALFALGSTLVHGVRGRDEEGSSILRRSATLAEQHNLHTLQASAIRELSYIDALAGRYARCERRLAEATAITDSDAELAALESVRAMAAGDRGAHDAARSHTDRAIGLAQSGGDLKRMAFALSFEGRSHLLAEDLVASRVALERALAVVGETDWLAFASWPEAWLAEVELMEGNLSDARKRMEYAFALGCEFRDPCWEGLAGRGLGLIEEREGNTAAAMRRLEDARQRAARTTDCYVWVEAYALEALAGAAVRAESNRGPALVEDLRSLAGRTGMREMTVRAFLLRAQLGDPKALDAARVIAAETENPALVAEVESAGSI